MSYYIEYFRPNVPAETQQTPDRELKLAKKRMKEVFHG